jgi:hypothetical protein
MDFFVNHPGDLWLGSYMGKPVSLGLLVLYLPEIDSEILSVVENIM